MRRLALLPATALLVLAGCTSSPSSDGPSADPSAGADGSSSPSASGTAAAPSGPACADIWKDGETLPANYDTCVVDGVAAEQDTTDCLDGRTLVAYNNTFFAITGEKIIQPDVAPMQDTEEFATAYSACTGE